MTEEVKTVRKAGRPFGAKGPKNTRSLRQTKLKGMLGKLEQLRDKAIRKAEAILDTEIGNKDVPTHIQLAAAKLIIDKCIELNDSVYGKEKDQLEDPVDDEPEEKPQQARFSTKVVSIKGD